MGENMQERIVRAVGCLILAVGGNACAGGLSGYSKAGVSDQQKSTDYYECQRDSSVPVWRSDARVGAGYGEDERLHESPRLYSPLTETARSVAGSRWTDSNE